MKTNKQYKINSLLRMAGITDDSEKKKVLSSRSGKFTFWD